MTYCLGIKVKAGLFALADTRITSGTDTSSAKKLFVHEKDGKSVFLMTSGLRSVRDKVLTYFQETLEEQWENYNKLYKVVNALGEQVRKVAVEDREALESAGLHFNLHTIIGGQMNEDSEPKMFLLYPEGNWIEVSPGSPCVIIGNTGYGKPILNRTINYQSSLKECLKAGFLSFDSTRVSANDVDYPIDVLIYHHNANQIIQDRYEKDDLKHISSQWDESLKQALQEVPEEWMEKFLNRDKEFATQKP